MKEEYSETLETIEILKIYHDEKIEEFLAKYPLEKGYDVSVLGIVTLDARTERITFLIKKLNLDKDNIHKKDK